MRCCNRPELLLGKGVLFTFEACQLGGEFGYRRRHTFFALLQPNTQPCWSIRFQPVEPEWAAGQKEQFLFMWTVWASVQQGNTVCPLRLDSLVFAAEPNGGVREKALPPGVWMCLSVKAEETPTLGVLMKGAFQPWGIHILSAAAV